MNKYRTKHKTSAVAPPQAQESMNALAEGMADNFNNILTTVLGACSLIDKDDPANVELQHCVALIRDSAERAAALSDRLVNVSTMERDDVCASCHLRNTDPVDRSVNDKKTINDIVSATKHHGGTPS